MLAMCTMGSTMRSMSSASGFRSAKTRSCSARAAIRFERLQGLHSIGELPRRFAQTITMELGVVHFATRHLQVIAGQQRVRRAFSRLVGRKFGSGRGGLHLGEQTSDIA
jgi:hypothetical protein